MNARWWLTGALVLLTCVIARAQQQPTTPARPPVPAPAPSPTPAAVPAPEPQKPVPPRGAGSGDDVPMPMERIEKPTLLDTQIEAIRAAVPGFNSVIVRTPGVASNYPMLPPMSLKNVTIDQFMRFVQAAFPSVDINPIEGPNGTLYTIRIRGDDDAELAPRPRSKRIAFDCSG